MELKINPTFKNLIPALSEEEKSQLTENLIKDGCRDPIVVWNNTIVDGHNRYEICSKHGISFETVECPVQGDLDVQKWIIENQFGRRNLTAYVRGVLALKMKDIESQQARERMLKGKADPVQNSAQGIKTAEILAKKNLRKKVFWEFFFYETQSTK